MRHAGAISASCCVEAPSRHRRDSRPSDEVVGGFSFEFEAVRTAYAPRSTSSRRTSSSSTRSRKKLKRKIRRTKMARRTRRRRIKMGTTTKRRRRRRYRTRRLDSRRWRRPETAALTVSIHAGEEGQEEEEGVRGRQWRDAGEGRRGIRGGRGREPGRLRTSAARASCPPLARAQSTAPPGANQCSTLSRRPPTARGRCSGPWPTHHHQETI